jgi:hypothetical protein
MEVDAGKRRPGGGRRGSHEKPMMDKPSELYQIQEPEAPAKREILHLTGIRSHGPATPRAVGRPWPRQVAWREALRRAKSIGP